MQFLFFCFIERQDGSMAVDVNSLVSRRGSRLRNSSWRERNSPRFAIEHPATWAYEHVRPRDAVQSRGNGRACSWRRSAIVLTLSLGSQRRMNLTQPTCTAPTCAA